jgi:malate synthase
MNPDSPAGVTERRREAPTAGRYLGVEGLQVDAALFRFLADEALPGSGTDEASFSQGLSSLVKRFAHRNAALLAERARLQDAIDGWHRDHVFNMRDTR